MEPILTAILIALFYYLIFIFAANKIVLRKFRPKPQQEDKDDLKTIYYILAVNINIICALFLTQDPIMNYMTFLIKDDFGFFNVLAAGSIILLSNAIVLFISYILAEALSNLLRFKDFRFILPILWFTINLILLKLTILYYEAYITTQSVTIF